MGNLKIDKCPGKNFSVSLFSSEGNNEALAALREHAMNCDACIKEYWRLENLYSENSPKDHDEFDTRYFDFMERRKTDAENFSAREIIKRCPGKRLNNLLIHIECESFENLKIEPTTEGARFIAEHDNNPNPPPYDLEEYYQFLVMFYKRRQEIGKEIYSYGNNRDEIINNLSEHVAGCPECSERYRDFIDMKFRSAKRAMKQKQPEACSCMTFRDLEELKRKVDRKYLGMFVRD